MVGSPRMEDWEDRKRTKKASNIIIKFIFTYLDVGRAKCRIRT